MTRKEHDPETKAKSRRAVAIADKVRSELAGHPPEVQGAALADLTMTWLLGHHPEDRAMILATHYEAVRIMAEQTSRLGYDPWKGPEPAQRKH